jgi:hypothetical protein
MFYKRLTFLMQLKFRSWQQKSFPTSAHFISLQFLIKFHSGINTFGSKIEDSQSSSSTTTLNHLLHYHYPQPPSTTIILNHHLPKLTWHNFSFTDSINYPV